MLTSAKRLYKGLCRNLELMSKVFQATYSRLFLKKTAQLYFNKISSSFSSFLNKEQNCIRGYLFL